jgi:hypothetical protein
MPRSRSTLLVVAGLCFLGLGAGNAITGHSKMNEYRVHKRQAVAAGGEIVKLPFSGTPSILDPSTDAQLVYESASIKYEYYRIVRRGGYYFLGLGGALLLAAALFRPRRPRSSPGTSPPGSQVPQVPGSQEPGSNFEHRPRTA